ncbi:hypothetical protein DHEL01_v201025 [Diaporthe helianthi]|uniref:Uncharacterized protein n=1 Tax=Diaporthe helianthi TaxID=158607 RepID=A0A2P5IDG7_DIAHE|nr:hypothetical protein DHEL01_v201025 [Diaporthe helianthi]
MVPWREGQASGFEYVGRWGTFDEVASVGGTGSAVKRNESCCFRSQAEWPESEDPYPSLCERDLRACHEEHNSEPNSGTYEPILRIRRVLLRAMSTREAEAVPHERKDGGGCRSRIPEVARACPGYLWGRTGDPVGMRQVSSARARPHEPQTSRPDL